MKMKIMLCSLFCAAFFYGKTQTTQTTQNSIIMENKIVKINDLVKATDEKFALAKLATTENYNIIAFDFKAKQILAKHTTPVDAFLMSLKGDALVTIGENEYTLKTGEFLKLPAEIPHEVKAITNCNLILVK